MCRGTMKNINIIKSSYISKRTVENMRIARIRKNTHHLSDRHVVPRNRYRHTNWGVNC